ncbi:MAG: hypothetical protein ACRD02_11935 [Acidimicrobiia bacterium]
MADPLAENILEAFIDYFNARDLEGFQELFSNDVSSDFFGGSGVETVLEGMGDFFLRQPTVLATRGDLGEEAVVVTWMADGETDEYRMLGYLAFSFHRREEGDVIEHITHVDQPDDSGELLAEEPEPDEIAEWEDWSAWDES